MIDNEFSDLKGFGESRSVMKYLPKSNVNKPKIDNDNVVDLDNHAIDSVQLPKKKGRPADLEVSPEIQEILSMKPVKKGASHPLNLSAIPLVLYCRIRKYSYEHGMSMASFFYKAAERYIDSLEKE